MPAEEIKAFDVPKRRPIYVYLKNNRQARGLSKYGEVVFSSRQGKYTCLYVADSAREEVIQTLMKLPYVVKVETGILSDLADNFADAFHEINETIKKELPGM